MSQGDKCPLIAGPTVFICDECILICVAIIAEDGIDITPALPESTLRKYVKVALSERRAKRLARRNSSKD